MFKKFLEEKIIHKLKKNHSIYNLYNYLNTSKYEKKYYELFKNYEKYQLLSYILPNNTIPQILYINNLNINIINGSQKLLYETLLENINSNNIGILLIIDEYVNLLWFKSNFEIELISISKKIDKINELKLSMFFDNLFNKSIKINNIHFEIDINVENSYLVEDYILILLILKSLNLENNLKQINIEDISLFYLAIYNIYLNFNLT